MKKVTRWGLLALVAGMALAETASAQSLSLSCGAFYGSGYRVGWTGSWASVPGASYYLVEFFRQDACGSASWSQTQTWTYTNTGLYPNCGAPSSCYTLSATVKAIGSGGFVLTQESCGGCWVGNP